MENTIKNRCVKVLICDDTVDTGVRMASELSRLNMFAYTRKNDGDVILHSILSDKPDIVVADLSLDGGTDSIAVMSKAKSILSQCPEFIIFSEINNNFIRKQVLESGASYFFAKPFDTSDISEAINKILAKDNQQENYEAEIIVTELIQKIGIPANIRGYSYVRTAILECIDNLDYINSVTKVLYPKVAEKHDTTSTRVERAIRHAIETTWNRGSKENIYKAIGYGADIFSKPTNSEFISLIADKVRLMIKTRNRHSDSMER